MEMPRAFSSGRRSVSTPVSVLTRRVLPWSMCPAVATIMSVFRSAYARSKLELAELRDEFRFAVEAAQVHDESAFVDTPDDRHRKRPECRCDALRAGAFR